MTYFDDIPDELKELNQWVCVYNNSKVPMQAFRQEAASSTNPSTWASFEAARWAVENGYYDGIGFVFADNGIIGIDIDAGVDEVGGITGLANDIINRCDSYTEMSRSGRGFHIFVRGDIPFKGKNNLAGVEIYKTGRFFIMTGNYLPGQPRYLCKNQLALDSIVGKYFPNTREEKERASVTRIYNPQWDNPKGSKRVRVRPQYPTIPDGARNICLTSLAGMMHSIGYSKIQIYEELQYANDVACKPPLPLSELKTICNSVTRYRR